jgi:polyisoprenoid-binding protein YceI
MAARRRRDRQLRSVVCAALLTALGATVLPATSWQVAGGPSKVTFEVSHLVFSEVSGRFRSFTGSVDCPDDDFERAVIEATIAAESIYTGHEDRDRHLKSDDFLDAGRFPEIRFASRSVRRTGEESFEIIGELTIRGVTREIVLDATSMGRRETTRGARLDFHAHGTLDRRDFGLRWNKIWDGKALLGEKVEIDLNVALVEIATAGR